MSTRILWKGRLREVETPADIMEELRETSAALVGRPCPPRVVLDACERLGHAMGHGETPQFADALRTRGLPEAKIQAGLAAIAGVLDRNALERKYVRELGSLDPFIPERPDYRHPILEAWAPLGVLLHVVPSNSPTVAPLSVLEGLMAGNVNLLKNSARNGEFPLLFLQALAAADPTETLAPLLFGLTVSSRDAAVMQALYAASDGVAVWGGDKAVSAVRSSVAAHVRLVEWGHKISFSCFSAQALDDVTAMEAVARDVCVIEQQACSSPQCLLVETADTARLHAFAHAFADVLRRVSAAYPQEPPNTAEAAEITTTLMMAEYEACLGRGEVIADPGQTWRVLVNNTPGLMPSPLYRTVWIVPFERSRLAGALRPYRGYLQTSGLACAPTETPELTTALFASGVTRVVAPGAMLKEYAGQPHDGTYALQRYARRVSVNRPHDLGHIAGFHDFYDSVPLPTDAPIMTKNDFSLAGPNHAAAGVYFRSGGTTGTPKASAFSWEEYAEQMAAAAEGLVAAGLDPATDRCANLYHCGGMYGSFISFWSILEHAKAVQLPIAALHDFSLMAEYIIHFRANTILGMPFLVSQLFETQSEKFKAYGGIKKLFLAGEHISREVEDEFRQTYGVELIKSAIYGSNDAGVLGYACPHCEPGVFHVMDRLQHIEIVEIDTDTPVPPGGEGRVIVSSRNRKAQRIRRYEIGDLARRIDTPCPCGRKAPRLQLLGRHGDIFKVGPLFHISAFTQALEAAGYTRNMQIVLTKANSKTLITVRVEAGRIDPDQARTLLLDHVAGLSVVLEDHVGTLEVRAIPPEEFELNAVTGKLRPFIDLRSKA